MFKRTRINSCALLALGGAVLLPLAAEAQEAQRVEVTGSRIKTLNAVSNSPISSVAEEEIKSTQPMAVEEVIRGLPAAVPAVGPGTNNGTGGGATIDLRGLGDNRTLVLVNGRRLVPFDLNGVVDTNSIPIALLRRIDLVTGGASAVYGADAVAGVANFILKRDFQGVDLSTSYGVSNEGDAKRRRVDLTVGSSLADGRGNVALSVGKTLTDALRQGERPWGLVSRSSTTGRAAGSFTTVPGFFDSAQISAQIDPATGGFSDGVETFNFNPLNYYVTPLDRMQATALANYTISPRAEVYAELMYSRSNVGSTLAPSGTFFNTFDVPIGNPFIQEPARQALCAAYGIAAANCVAGDPTTFTVDIGRRFVEMGPRLNDFKNKTLQTTVGLKGEIFKNWTYDAYISHGEADQLQLRGNWGSSSKVQQALLSVDPATCLNPSNGCVPLNVFGAAGSITPEMIKFINLSALLTQSVRQDIVAASVSGDLGNAFKSPMARQPIGVAFGVETRKMKAGNQSDSATQIQGEVLGTGAPSPDVTGTFKLNEAYAEAIIPLISNAAFARSLNLEVGYRGSSFKTSSKQSYGSWKFGGDWEPAKGLRLRAMAQRATRAPNVNELFAPLVTGLDNLAVDPCQGANINLADAATPGTLSNLCVQTGVPLARVGTLPEPSAGQVNTLTGGNPNLGPEEADTYTLGFIWEPEFAPGLSVGLDFYKIDINKAVSSPAVADILGDCYSAATNPTFNLNTACRAVGRGPGGTFNGASAPGIALPQSNLGRQATSGADLTVGYRLPLKSLGINPAMGVVDLALNLNQVNKFWFQATPKSVKRDCLGFYSVACGPANGSGGGGSPTYEQKFSQRTTWAVGDFRVGYNWRHVSGVIEEPGGTNFLPAFSRIKAYDYVDVAASWNVTKNATVNLSITNLFDKNPPEVGNTIGTTNANSGNTYPQFYDAVGRSFTIGANLKF